MDAILSIFSLSSPAKAGDPVHGNTIRGHGRIRLLDTPLSRGMTAGLMIAVLGGSPAFAGTWKYEFVQNDGHVVTYVEDGKTIFYIGCGRGFALHAKYPSTPKTEGDATIQIATARDRVTFKGEFEEPIEATDPVPGNFATTFVQTYLGYAKRDPRVFGKAWDAQKARVLDMLDSHSPITISAGKDSYQLPAIDAGDDWHKKLDACQF
jgi:hypothetical protein